MHYIFIWLQSVVKNKYLLFLAIVFTFGAAALKVLNLLPQEQGLYTIVSAVLIAIIYSLYFLALKRTKALKISYRIMMIFVLILIIIGCLELLSVITLPERFLS